MNIDNIIGLLLFTAVIVFFTVLALLDYEQKRRSNRHQPPKDEKERSRRLDTAFKKLNVKCLWKTDDDGNQTGQFDYQDGHFRASLIKQEQAINIAYLFFYDAQMDDAHMVRIVANRCNTGSNGGRVVYSTDEESGRINVHILTTIPDRLAGDAAFVSHVLAEVFALRNNFVGIFSGMKEAGRQMHDNDYEVDQAKWEHQLYLMSKTELAAQHEQLPTVDFGRGIRLRQLVATLPDWDEWTAVSLTVSTDGISRQYDDNTSIQSLDVGSLLVDGQQVVHQQAMLLLTALHPASHGKERTLTVHLMADRDLKQALFYRATITLVPLSAQPMTPIESNGNRVSSRSLLLCYSKQEEKQLNDEFIYMWKEALEKHRQGDDTDLTEEQKLICETTDANQGYLLYRGRALFGQNCFADAVHYLEEAFRTSVASYHQMKKNQREHLMEVAYLIGFSYCQLEQWEKAHYYLEMTLQTHRVVYTIAFVNCLVNGRDPRAMEVVEGIMAELYGNHDEEDDDDDWDAESLTMINFLRRRKGYLLVEQGRLDEAEEVFRSLLDEQESTDYAIRELAHIQHLREKEKE